MGEIVAASSNFKPFFNFRYVHQVDAGVYECQINTEPKMSHFVRLKVLGELVEDCWQLAISDLEFK